MSFPLRARYRAIFAPGEFRHIGLAFAIHLLIFGAKRQAIQTARGYICFTFSSLHILHFAEFIA